MPIRTINAPGVEIREVDISQIAPSIVGTSVLVMGYTPKGEAYNPVDIVSTSDLETNFGTPTNEAERYFYYACKEIINQNGNLVAAKIPYTNVMDVNYKYVPVEVDSGTSTLGTVSADLSTIGDAVMDLSGSTTITAFKKVSLGTVNTITIDDYDVLKAGGTYSAGGAEFVIVNENKSKISGPNSDEGLFVAIVDPVHGMLVQRTIQSSDSDAMDLIYSGELSGSTFVANLSATYAGSSISEDVMRYFPTVEFSSGGSQISNEYGSWITVVVMRTVANSNLQGQLEVSYLEAHTGSLVTTALDSSTGASVYIGNIINRNSDYIRWYATAPSSHPLTIASTTCLYAEPQGIDLLSFTTADSNPYINGDIVVTEMEKVLEKLSNIDERQIDIVIDGGLSTIAQFRSVTSGLYDPINDDYGSIASSDDTSAWRAVASSIDNFCKNVRKDCIGIVDGPRNLVLEADQKFIRKTAPNNTFGNTISPTMRYITGLNSSYLAAYIDWMKTTDAFSGNDFWLPPSVKAAGIYVLTDTVANIWDAPAGLNRGQLNGVNDIAFNPNIKEAGQVYTKSFNYAKQYPLEGFILEGQKTTQVKPSAFDRVNVRRLFLRLERLAYQVSRYFVYEPNNIMTRRRLISTLDPTFRSIKAAGGLYDYRLICDDSNNTSDVIDNNELRVAIALKPTRTAEFILVDFIALRTGGSFSEVI